MSKSKQWMTTAQVAASLGCSVKTVHRLVDAAQLCPAVKMPGLRGGYLFEPADVDALRIPQQRSA